ncbi:hypothetical protein T440DRAFT_484602, partial [Plenodomus tracheiphilus IPT5]
SDTGVKRKDWRRPKPDKHAPRQSPSAYAIFSRQMGQMLKERNQFFTESAKVISVKWQLLSSEEHDNYRGLANDATLKYFAELAEYKKTPQYEAYRSYLEAEDAESLKGYKCSKLKEVTNSTTRIDYRNPHEQAMDSSSDSVQPETATMGDQRSVISLSIDNACLSADTSSW